MSEEGTRYFDKFKICGAKRFVEWRLDLPCRLLDIRFF